MNTSEKEKPESSADELIVSLGGIEEPTFHVPGDTGLAVGYTQSEIEEAKKVAAEIVRLSQNVGKTVYELVAVAIEFRDRQLYLRLGYHDFASWYSGQHYSVYSISRYMKIYEELHLKHQIELDDFRLIDIGKSRCISQLINAGADGEQLRKSLEVLDQLELSDAITWTEEAVENLKADRDVSATYLTESERPAGSKPFLECGFYTMQLVPRKDIGEVDPEINGALKRIRKVKSSIFKDEKKDIFIIEIR